ncbi:MAG TPA: nucleic acid-binding protein [Thermoplasmatales archaeon]|nr:nucleic acid-binding protein [Thermoplasmatales archaeon]
MDMNIFVLDASAILSGKPIELDGILITVPSVKREVSKRHDYAFEFFLSKGLSIESPSKESMSLVEKVAEEIGEKERLSQTDKEIVAIALDKRGKGNVCILTDDYSIQNIASMLGIRYQGISEKGITKKFVWRYKCEGCKKVFKERLSSCPICGSKLKPFVKRKMAI